MRHADKYSGSINEATSPCRCGDNFVGETGNSQAVIAVRCIGGGAHPRLTDTIT